MNEENNPNADHPHYIDPLKDTYHEKIVDNPLYLKSLEAKDTALLVIDMQYLDAAEGYGVFKDVATSGVHPEDARYYFDQLKEKVIPNVVRLQKAFRTHRMEVIHTRIQSLTRDGRDRSAGHKRLGLLATPGSKEAEFLPEVAPAGDEIVINKTASGVFPTTNLYFVLKNMGINALFVAGVYTNECVSSTVRAACDMGFHVTMVEDCCTTVTPELHEFTVATLRDRYCRVIDTDQALQEIDKYVYDVSQREVATPRGTNLRGIGIRGTERGLRGFGVVVGCQRRFQVSVFRRFLS